MAHITLDDFTLTLDEFEDLDTGEFFSLILDPDGQLVRIRDGDAVFNGDIIPPYSFNLYRTEPLLIGETLTLTFGHYLPGQSPLQHNVPYAQTVVTIVGPLPGNSLLGVVSVDALGAVTFV